VRMGAEMTAGGITHKRRSPCLLTAYAIERASIDPSERARNPWLGCGVHNCPYGYVVVQKFWYHCADLPGSYK
jgi:hypothetical protein